MLPVLSDGFYNDYCSVNKSAPYDKSRRRKIWDHGANRHLGLVTADGQLNGNPGVFVNDTLVNPLFAIHPNADNSSCAHYYNMSMNEIPYPYSCIGSAYVPPNPFPASYPADTRTSLPLVPIRTSPNTTSQRDPNNNLGQSRLSHAVTAGIAVGYILAASSMVIGFYMVIYRRRRGNPLVEP